MSRRIPLFPLFSIVALLFCRAGTSDAQTKANPESRPNQLTSQEKVMGWQLLFDGHSTAGWRSYKTKTFPEKGWVVEGECLKHLAGERGGDLISDRAFYDFDLQFEWKIPAGANSGLKYCVTEDRSAPLGHEYQLIDDAVHPDARRGPKWQTASFYDVLPATNRVVRPPGEFNQSRILVSGNHVEHWLNGVKALEYELGSPAVLEAVAASKFKNVAGFGTHLNGHLLLQDHGDEICFRNLKIRELGSAPGKPRAQRRTNSQGLFY